MPQNAGERWMRRTSRTSRSGSIGSALPDQLLADVVLTVHFAIAVFGVTCPLSGLPARYPLDRRARTDQRIAELLRAVRGR